MKFCSKCGCQLKDDDLFCPSCGNKVEPLDNKIHVSADLRNIASSTGDNVSNKSRLCAALLAFFLGAFGIHRFYMGKKHLEYSCYYSFGLAFLQLLQ